MVVSHLEYGNRERQTPTHVCWCRLPSDALYVSPTHIDEPSLPLAAAATGSVLHALALPDRDCGLGVGGCGTHALLDLAGHGEESLLDVGGALCGGLEEGDAEAVCELL
jgi:hypothetical protein